MSWRIRYGDADPARFKVGKMAGWDMERIPPPRKKSTEDHLMRAAIERGSDANDFNMWDRDEEAAG
jgi:hypothetical protein